MNSFSVSISPIDSRCKYWAKIVRANKDLPMPETIERAADISGNYLRRGEEEIMPGDVLFEGEEMHHRKTRGWLYTVSAVTPAGSLLVCNSDWREFKSAMKIEGGFDPMLLKGAGDLAACVRFAHIARLGGLQNLRGRAAAAASLAAINAAIAPQQKHIARSHPRAGDATIAYAMLGMSEDIDLNPESATSNGPHSAVQRKLPSQNGISNLMSQVAQPFVI